jgi:NAD(P)-dependent dehydrogenase (short-subunit alcohol dehydrogenase family)
MDINGKLVLVTGSAKRVGRAIAVELGRRGARVAVHYRKSRRDAELTRKMVQEAGSDSILVQADLTEVSEVERLFEKLEGSWGGLHILVNNASVFGPSTPDTTSEAHWNEQMDANARGPFFVAQHAARLMKPMGEGKIVNLADVAGEIVWPGYFAYSVSKAALLAVNRGLARALAPAIQVNAIAPGPVLFPAHYTEAQKSLAIERTLLKRAGSPEDVVRAVVFLIENDYITGELIHVDGGRHLM